MTSTISLESFGYTEMALLGIPERSKIQHYLEQVLIAANRAKDLVKQILTFSRQSDQERRPLQLSLIVKEVLKLLKASLPKTIKIQQNIETCSGTVMADSTEIHQVLMNLCTNAAHAMRGKGGVLEVGLVDVDISSDPTDQYLDINPGPYVRLTVSDTGHGIDSAVMKKMFDPFFTTKEAGEGTGMGLAVVHGIIKSYGGAITVDSELGKGTAFHIFLPRIENKVTEETRYLVPLPTGSERILFIDDDDVLVKIGEKMLTQLGYKVISKTGPIEALEIFRAQPDKFDLVITDQTMPNMTGTELAEELIRIQPDIPIILCTGFSAMVTPEKVEVIGIRKLVMKPIILHEIAEIIRHILDGE